MPHVRLTFDVSPELDAAIARIGHETGRTKAEVIRRSVALIEVAHEARKRGLHFGAAEQGFVDQFGAFLTREEAWAIASAAAQIIHPLPGREGTLYSENLY